MINTEAGVCPDDETGEGHVGDSACHVLGTSIFRFLLLKEKWSQTRGESGESSALFVKSVNA